MTTPAISYRDGLSKGRLLSEPAVFVALATLVVAAKLAVLDTPYYWDETLWVGFAHKLADRPLHSVLPGLHPPFLFGNRPPGLFLPMAALFKVAGPSIWLSHAYILAFAFAGVWFTYRLATLWLGRAAGFLAALFLFLSPTYFTQSAMFLSDVPTAALGVATVYFGVRRRYAPYWIAAMPLLFMKEPAVTIVAALAAWMFLVRARDSFRGAVGDALRYAAPLAVVALYYAWQWQATGHAFVHYAWAFEPFSLDASVARRQAGEITRWIFFEQGRWPFTAVLAAGAVPLALRHPRELLLVALLILAAGYSYSCLYLLPRYLLPVAPFFFAACAGALVSLLRDTRARIAAGALLGLALVMNLEERPPRGNREWNMGYLQIVEMHRDAAAYVERELDGRAVLTPFPFGSVLSQPELGYVGKAVNVVWQRAGAVGDVESAEVIVVGVPGDSPQLRSYARDRKLPELATFRAGSDFVTIYATRSFRARTAADDAGGRDSAGEP